jgi:hypothetical protein
MMVFEQDPLRVFPFPITGCSEFTQGAVCTLHAEPSFIGGVGQVSISLISSSSFKFTVTSHGYFDGPGSTITFSASQQNGSLYLSQHGVSTSTATGPWVAVQIGFAKLTWSRQALNLQGVLGVQPTPAIVPGG